MSIDFWVGVGLGLLGIAVTIAVAMYQTRAPRLSVEFSCPNDEPNRLQCQVVNAGRGTARDVFIVFGGKLVSGTRLYAEPDLDAKLVKSDRPPNPNHGRAAAALQRAFAVGFKFVPPRSRTQFEVRAEDPDNVRAARQIRFLRMKQESIIHQFGMRLKADHPALGRFGTNVTS